MTVNVSSSLKTSGITYPMPFSVGDKKEKEVTKKSPKNLALAITLAVLGIILIVVGLAVLFLLPHFGVVMSPMLALIAVPVLVGLVKIAAAIFILHKPAKEEIEEEAKVLDKDITQIINSNEDIEKRY